MTDAKPVGEIVAYRGPLSSLSNGRDLKMKVPIGHLPVGTKLYTVEAYEAVKRERDEAQAWAKRLVEALEPFVRVPERGIHGGPMVVAKVVYEDGTDENSARHKGRIGPEDFRRARVIRALKEKEG